MKHTLAQWMQFMSLLTRSSAQATNPPSNVVPFPVAKPQPQPVDNPQADPLALIGSICKRVRESVLQEFASVLDPVRLKQWIDQARHALTVMHRGPFDPVANPEDAQLKRAEEEIDAAIIAQKNIVGQQETAAKIARDAVPAPEPRPPKATPVIMALWVSFAILFGFTFFELPMLKGIRDIEARMLISLIPGLVFAAVLVFTQFDMTSTDDDGAPVIYVEGGLRQLSWQTAAGFLSIVGFLVMRLCLTHGFKQNVLTFGIAIVELALWAYGKSAANRQAIVDETYAKGHHEEAQKQRTAELAEGDLAASKAALDALVEQKAAIQRKRAARERLNFNLNQMVDHAASEITATYTEAIAEIAARRAFGKYTNQFQKGA